MKITLITSDNDLEEIQRTKEEAQKAGHTVNIVDYTNFHYSHVDGKTTFNPELPPTDVAIIRGMFSAMRSIDILKQYLISRKIKVFDNSLLTHKYSINKVLDITQLIFAGIPVPDFYHARSYVSLRAYAKTMKYPAVIKTAGTGKGASIYMAKDEPEMLANLAMWEKAGHEARKLVIQNFIDYEHDLRVLVLGKEMFCMKRIPQTGDFRANFSLGGSVELFPLTKDIRSLSEKAMKAIDLKIAGVDVLIDKAGKLYILEVNHTPGFLGMEQATGKNIGKMYLDFAIKNAKRMKK